MPHGLKEGDQDLNVAISALDIDLPKGILPELIAAIDLLKFDLALFALSKAIPEAPGDE